MPINIEEMLERAMEQAFLKALDEVIQKRAAQLFKKAFERNSPLAKKLGDKFDEVFQHFIEEGIQWEKKQAGFTK